MGEPNVLTAIGLKTSTNELGATPTGGLRKAQNCILWGRGLVGPRQGQYDPFGYAPAANPRALALFGDTLIANTDSDTLEYNSGTAFVPYSGSYAPPAPGTLRMKFASASSCLYFTTSKGIRRLDVKENAPVLAGGPRTAQIVDAELHATTVGYLPAGSSVAYRVVFGVKDANGLVHLGPPSGRIVVDNLSGEVNYDGAAKNVDLGIGVSNVQALLNAKAFWQVYRTKAVSSYKTVDNVSVYVPPDDEMYLCQEGYFTRDELGVTSFSIVDTAPDDFLGPPLYTNAVRGAGIAGANDAPPLAWDLASFDQRMFYLNTRRYPQMILRILGVGAGKDGYTGVRIGDQITLLGNTYTAAANYSLVDQTFAVVTSYLDPEDNVNATAQSLVKLINASNAGYAQLLSEASANGTIVPGQILVQSYDLDAAVWQARLTTRTNTVLAANLVRVGTTVTVATVQPHGMLPGDTVYMGAATPDVKFPVGVKTVTAVGPSAYEFTYTEAGTAGASTKNYTSRRLTPDPQFAWSPAPPPTVFGVAAGGLSRTSNVVTVTCDTAHDLSVGMAAPIEPAAAADPNFLAGTYPVTEIVSSTVFKVTWSGSDAVSTVAYQSGARVAADPSRMRNGLYFSKVQEPEAVPFFNYFPVGAPDKDAYRILACQNYLFVFKEDGIFVVSPTGDVKFPYRVDPLDPTVRVYAPDSVQSVRGLGYALTNQGVVEVHSSGIRNVSEDIEDDLFQYFSSGALSSVKVESFGVSLETDKLYALWLPALDGAQAPYDNARAYVYAPGDGGAWTTWELPRACGIVRPSDDTLFTGNVAAALTPVVFQRRNTRTSADYADAHTTLSVLGWDAATLKLTVASAAGVIVGDAIVWDIDSISPAFDPAIVTAVNGSNLTLSRVVPIDPGYATGAIYVGAYAAGVVGAYVGGYPYSAPVSQDVGAYINGYLSSWAWNYSDDLTAWYVYNAINMNPSLSGVVTAAVVWGESVVQVTAVTEGSVGNFITLGEYASANTGVTVSGPTLSGGDDVKTFATGWVQVPPSGGGGGGGGGGPKGVYVNGNLVSVPFNIDGPTTAADLTAAVNADPIVSTLVTATQYGRSVALTAVTAGAGGNSISLGTYGSGVDVSGPYLTGGSDGAKATGTITLSNARGISLAQGIEALATLINNTSPLVSASVVGLNVNLTARTGGVAGNSITLSGIGLIDGVSASTLTGGVDSYVICAAGIPIDLEWRTISTGSPADTRTSRAIHLHHRQMNYHKATLAFATDLSESTVPPSPEETQEVYPAKDPDTNEVPDYTADPDIYTGRPVRPKKIRVGIPSTIARGAYLDVAFRIREAYALWTLNGISIIDAQVGPKGQR